MKKMLAKVLVVALTVSVATTSAMASSGYRCAASGGSSQNTAQILQLFTNAGSAQGSGNCNTQLNALLSQLFAQFAGNTSWSCGQTPSRPDTECPNGDCDEAECPNGDCDEAECPNGDCNEAECPNGDCDEAECPNGDCDEAECPNGDCETPDVDVPSVPDNGSDPDEGTSSEVEYTSPYREYQLRVIALVNEQRAAAGLNALTESAALDKVATAKSQDMANLNYFSHTSPTYGSPFEMLKQFGISYSYAGENIAMGQTTPAEVMNDWMNSEGHRANILNSHYTQIGVGIVKNSSGRYIWTQTFLRP